MTEQENIDLLFDQIVQEESDNTVEVSSIHLKEQERLSAIHSLSENNIDEAFNVIANNQYEHIYDEYIGKTFNKWTVVKYYGTDIGKNKIYECICQCGGKSYTRISRLKNNRSKQCKKCAVKIHSENLKKINIQRNIGLVFGNRTIIRATGESRDKKILYECLCICGNKSISTLTNMKNYRNLCIKCPRIKIGQIFNQWTVLEHIGIKKNKSGKGLNYYKCQCTCGNIKEIPASSLSLKKTTRCLRCATGYLDVKIGDVFGSRTVIEVSNVLTKTGARKVMCKCKCGEEKLVYLVALKSNRSNQCVQCNKINLIYERK